MQRKTWYGAALGLFVAAALSAQSLDDILDKHFKALGGKEKLAAVKSVKMTGKQSFGPQEAPFTLYWKEPNRLRIEFTFQGMTGIQAFDGKVGWQVSPFMGKTDPEPMAADDLKESQQEAADVIGGSLFNYKEKGSQVELVGKDTVEGTAVWKLKVTTKAGDVEYSYLDADSMLEIKSEGKTKRQGQEIEYEVSVGDYKEVDGLYFPFSIEQKPKGAPQGSTITVAKIELNADVQDSVFAMPEVKKPEAKPSGN